ncbi:MAG: rhodanese-like domain-containing protein [Agrococcus sp.]
MHDLVSVDWLAEHHDAGDLVVVDASMAPPGSEEPLPADGIPGAVRFDIEGAMSRRDETDGLGPVGVHDVLSPDDFERALRALGIRTGDRVVAYDAAGMFSSARAWWMLRAAGIDDAVLDGGLPAWVAAGHPSPRSRRPCLESATSRWRGMPRRSSMPGHMPGARSLHYAAVAPSGRMLALDELVARLRDAAGDRPVIASCGSGVTAAVLALAATLTGRPAAVYDGSWSGWGRDDSGRPAVTGD